MSASVVELQLMATLCQDELDNIDMIVNTSKTMCIRIGPKFTVQCCQITLSNKQLQWVKVIRYLGVFVQSCKTFKLSFYDARKRFYIAANSIFSKVGKDNTAVVLSLVASFCTPLFLFGSETVSLNKTERIKLNNPYNIIYNKLFNTYNKSVLRNCQYFCGYLPFDLLYDLRYFRFHNKMSYLKEMNFTVYYLQLLHGNSEFTARAKPYDIHATDSDSCIKYKLWKYFEKTL